MNKELANPEELVDLQKHYVALYDRGVIGVDETRIHVTSDYFREIFAGKEVVTEWNGTELEVNIFHNGVKFIALF